VFVKVDPTSVPLEPGFTRDVSNVGHFGTGDLEITLSKPEETLGGRCRSSSAAMTLRDEARSKRT
jgi:hypothetical protein